MNPLPPHLSHLVHAEEIVPRQERESEHAYFNRLSSLGHQVHGYRNGELLLANYDGKHQSKVRPN